MKRTPWQRLTLSLIGLIIVTTKWWAAIRILPTMDKDHVSAFVTLTNNSDYVTAAIVIFMVTGKLVYDWKMETTNQVVTRGEAIISELRTPASKHFDD